MSTAGFDLTGKVALVTGAGRGLGLGFVRALAAAGADLVLVDRSGAPDAVAELREQGHRAWGIPQDLLAASPQDLTALCDAAVGEAGRLDILVNNAGIIRREPAIDFSEDNWQEVIDINLSAVFYLAQAAARVMVKQGEGADGGAGDGGGADGGGADDEAGGAGAGAAEPRSLGKIINVASMLSFQGGKNVASYTASKSGVMGLTRALANEWAPLGINVNAIAPGYFATDNTAPLRADADRSAQILGRIPAGRWGRPEDLGGAAVYLASAAADYVNGITLPVDGGWLAS